MFLPPKLQAEVRSFILSLPGRAAEHSLDIIRYMQELKKRSGPDRDRGQMSKRNGEWRVEEGRSFEYTFYENQGGSSDP